MNNDLAGHLGGEALRDQLCFNSLKLTFDHMRQGNVNYSQKIFGCSMMLHTLCCGAALCPFSLCPVLLFCPAACICICKECLEDTLVGDDSELLVRLWETATARIIVTV